MIDALPRGGGLCRTIQLSATSPSAAPRVLFSVPDWDAHFRRPYLYVRPQALTAGTRLVTRWVLDNSADNLANPSNPPKRVRLGADAVDELLSLVLWVSPRDPSDADLLREFLRESMFARLR